MRTNRTCKSRILTAVAALCAFNVIPTRVHATAPTYTVTVLGGESYAVAINASGQVVGNSYFAGASHAVRWTGTTPEDLGEFYASGINASGQVVGNLGGAWGTGNVMHAVRWTGTGATTTLYPFGNGSSAGYGINDSGVVAGSAYLYSFVYYNYFTNAIRWTGGTTVDEALGIRTDGYGINASRQVAGSVVIGGDRRAVRWTGTTPTYLGTLGGSNSYGYGINASGQIAGSADIAGNQPARHAVRWTGTTPTDLGTLGGSDSYGYGINASGQVTGMSDIAGDAIQHPFLYADETMYDLNTLLLPGFEITDLAVSQGNSINDLGQIAAYGYIGGQQYALRLDPVTAPEPASAVLLLGGTALIALLRRRSAAGV